jgi:hypothetical protein
MPQKTCRCCGETLPLKLHFRMVSVMTEVGPRQRPGPFFRLCSRCEAHLSLKRQYPFGEEIPQLCMDQSVPETEKLDLKDTGGVDSPGGGDHA